MCAVAVPTTTTTTMTPLFSPPKVASPLYKSYSLNYSSPSPSYSSLPRSVSCPPSASSLPDVDTVLKRKRPARIDVPTIVPSIGFGFGTFETPEVMEEEGEGYSVYCKRGRRRSAMEDRFSATVGIQGDSRQAFFGIFDGHGGAQVAEIAAKRMSENVIDQVTRRTESELEEAIKDGYLATDREVSEEGVSGGACSATALIRNGHLAVSNVGDCRAVLSRKGKAEALTSDHRACREDERNRIEKSGGYVDCCRGAWRVQGTLAVSRAIGDKHLKQWVISEPETRVVKIEDDCDYLILASDGLWDKITNQEAVDVVEAACGVEIMENKKPNPLLMSACKQLAALSASRGSVDDTTVMIIKLNCLHLN
ncbi:probable protein phosphatase 2C 2 [Cucurbita pepo subsp. pepo]|uniref:probable protein phosphatase 2C 2 n=1 Tax=Cucurbita pepo subsp. pepo TaxID=3664 RepID=UPI000C9D48B4|nr:probable protein phosphatase 2C 2 [Cucurbita pepo subsp. pepo]